MAYRYDPSTGTFVQTEGASPSSRRSPSSRSAQRPGAETPAPSVRQAAAPRRAEPAAQLPSPSPAPRKKTRTREKAGTMSYNPSTGEFTGRGAGGSSSHPSGRSQTTVPPTVNRNAGRSFPSRMEWFFRNVMTRVAVYLIAGTIISMCTRIFW